MKPRSSWSQSTLLEPLGATKGGCSGLLDDYYSSIASRCCRLGLTLLRPSYRCYEGRLDTVYTAPSSYAEQLLAMGRSPSGLLQKCNRHLLLVMNGLDS
jgi:hypothetical protein